jgi:hypothetical protein
MAANTDNIFTLPLQEGTGTPDEYETSTALTVGSAGTWQTPDATYEEHLLFNGSSEYYTFSDLGLGTDLNVNDEITITVAFNSSSSSAQSFCGTYNTGSTLALDFRMNQGGAGQVELYTRDDDGNESSSYISEGLNDGAWHIVSCALGLAAQTDDWVVDGVTATPTSASLGVADNWVDFDYAMAIGARNLRGTIDQYFSGDIALLYISNVKKTDAEMKAIHSDFYDFLAAGGMQLVGGAGLIGGGLIGGAGLVG